METEEAVEVEHRLARNVDAGPHRVILRLGMRDDDVQSIGGAPLKNDDETFVGRAGIVGAKSGAG